MFESFFFRCSPCSQVFTVTVAPEWRSIDLSLSSARVDDTARWLRRALHETTNGRILSLDFSRDDHDRESSADRRTKENIVLIIAGSRSIVSSFLLQWRSIYPFGRRSSERTLNRRFSWTSRHSTVAELRFTANFIITIMIIARVNSVFKRCRERSRILQLTESQLWDILFDSRWITSWPATTGQCFGPIDRSTSRRVRVAFDDEERKRRSE